MRISNDEAYHRLQTQSSMCMSEVIRLIKVYKEVDRGMSGSVVSRHKVATWRMKVSCKGCCEGFLMVV